MDKCRRLLKSSGKSSGVDFSDGGQRAADGGWRMAGNLAGSFQDSFPSEAYRDSPQPRGNKSGAGSPERCSRTEVMVDGNAR